MSPSASHPVKVAGPSDRDSVDRRHSHRHRERIRPRGEGLCARHDGAGLAAPRWKRCRRGGRQRPRHHDHGANRRDLGQPRPTTSERHELMKHDDSLCAGQPPKLPAVGLPHPDRAINPSAQVEMYVAQPTADTQGANALHAAQQLLARVHASSRPVSIVRARRNRFHPPAASPIRDCIRRRDGPIHGGRRRIARSPSPNTRALRSRARARLPHCRRRRTQPRTPAPAGRRPGGEVWRGQNRPGEMARSSWMRVSRTVERVSARGPP
jgi:hypothetical protein